MGAKQNGNRYSDRETQRRAETALRAAFASPPKPQSEMKLGKKPRGKKAVSPRRRDKNAR
jgi:hypothetical protein